MRPPSTSTGTTPTGSTPTGSTLPDRRTEHAEHAGHPHGVRADADTRYLTIALLLIVAFMLVEVVIGILASSLALISDAGHMLTDAMAIGLALVAMRLAATPASGRHTFGLKRVEIISAQVNGITLLVLAVLFVYEGIRRLITPPQVEGGLVFVVALVGIVINIAATWSLSRANRQSLNVEGSFQHILTDLYAFIEQWRGRLADERDRVRSGAARLGLR